MFKEEIVRLEKKLESGLVSSIWIQFGTDYKLLKSRIKILKNIIYSTMQDNSEEINMEGIHEFQKMINSITEMKCQKRK